MPIKQLPLWGNQGIFQTGDAAGATAGYPFFLNGYFEKTGNQEVQSRTHCYVKRPGTGTAVLSSNITNAHKIQGIVGSIDRSKIFLYSNSGAANRTWYWDGSTLTDRGAAPAAAGNWTNSGAVVFTILDGISYGANVYYAVTDFTKGAVVNATGTWTEITDADFTGLTKVTNFIGLDGYLFIGTSDNRIYNSDLNTATSWVATSFLTAADSPGALLWLGKIRNYLIAFKERSIEFFEDVGNPTPGSPLEARKQLNRTIGCINKSSIQEVSDGIIFAGAAGSQAPKLYKIDKLTLQIKEISSRYVERSLINGFSSSYSVDAVAAGATTQINNGQSQVFQVGGKEFYTITLPDPAVGGRYTQVFDNDLEVWTTWMTSFGAEATNDIAWGFVGSQAVTHNFSTAACAVFVDNLSSDATHPPRLLAMSPDLSVDYDYATSSAVTQRGFIFGWVSDNYDFGSRKRKFMDSFELLYDMKSSTAPDPTATTYAATLKYRDYDFNASTGYTATRSIPLDLGSGVRAIVLRFAPFRKRNFMLTFTAKVMLRIWGIELSLNEGETDQ